LLAVGCYVRLEATFDVANVVFVIVHATHSFVAKDILFLADLCCKSWVLAYFGGIAEICGIAALAMGPRSP